MGEANEVERDGYAIVRGVLNSATINELVVLLKPHVLGNTSAGIRGLAQKAPGVRALAESAAVRQWVEPYLGASAKLIRSVLFNKDQETNWQVAWHQDLSIAVREKVEVEGYSAWSFKEGLAHVQPPVAILENMLTVRLHLDAANENNGALWISPGTHRLGRIPASAAAQVAEQYGKRLCVVAPGDALLFRPLALHASRKSASDSPRRVIHFEFASVSLPEPLAWNEAA